MRFSVPVVFVFTVASPLFTSLLSLHLSPLLQTLRVCSAKMSSGSCKPSDSVDSDDSFWKLRTINGNTYDVENNHQMTVALSANNIYVRITSDRLIQLKTFCFLPVVADELSN